MTSPADASLQMNRADHGVAHGADHSVKHDLVSDPGLPADFSALSALAQKWMPYLQQGGNLAGLVGYSDEDLDVFYTAAYQLYEAGRHADAMPVFGFLAAMDPTQARFHHGVAACLQCTGRFKEAAGSFVLLKLMEPEQPEHLLHLAECLIGAGDAQAAAGMLESLVEECVNPAHAPLKSQAEALRKLLREPVTSP